jgi:hypothetical protein
MMKVRPVEIADADKIYAFQASHGFPAARPALWRDLWSCCPFREQFQDIPAGWLLEDDGEVVGVLANVHMLYELGGKYLKAGIAADWLVDPDHRRGSLQLLIAYFRQEGLDLWLNDTANPTASKIWTSLKAERIPAPDYDAPLLWPIRTRAFATAALRKYRAPAPRLFGLPLAAALQAERWLSGKSRFPKQVYKLKGFDERFDPLWDRIRTGSVRLRSVRTSSILQWRFQLELANGSAVVLAHGEDELQGYAVLLRTFRERFGLTISEVADLQAAGDNPVVLKDLLLASMHAAREQGADVLKLACGQGTKRTVALSLRPHCYRIDGWQLFYRAARTELTSALRSPTAWDISGFETF